MLHGFRSSLIYFLFSKVVTRWHLTCKFCPINVCMSCHPTIPLIYGQYQHWPCQGLNYSKHSNECSWVQWPNSVHVLNLTTIRQGCKPVTKKLRGTLHVKSNLCFDKTAMKKILWNYHQVNSKSYCLFKKGKKHIVNLFLFLFETC